MAKSKNTTRKKAEQPAESIVVTQQQTKRKPASARRVPVQYTPRIPTARCPGC